MADMSSKVRSEFDAAAAVELRDIADGAEAGADTDSETGVAISKLVGAYWDNGEVADGLIKVNIYITTIVDNSTNYIFLLEACNDAGGTGNLEVGRLTFDPVYGTGYYQFYVSSAMIAKIAPDADFMRIGCTKADASDSVVYGAWATYHGHD